MTAQEKEKNSAQSQGPKSWAHRNKKETGYSKLRQLHIMIF